MTKSMTLPFAIALCAIIMLPGGAFAREYDAMSDDASASESTDANTVPLFSGGIGDDEIAYIKSVQHQYNTKVLFTANNGEFLADIPVSIRDHQGHGVVRTVTKGPVLLVNLPEGSYILTATQNGVKREQKISISSHKMSSYQLRFPAQNIMSENSN